MSEVTNNFYIKGNYIAEQHIESQIINYTGGAGEPSSESLYPKKGDYAGVLAWLARQKEKEHIDYYLASGQNRSKMCRKLSEIFGWEVDESGIRKAEERQNREKILQM